MKVRNGFVSNSSSSSFVIIMTEEQQHQWLEKLNAYEKQVVDALSCSTDMFSGMKVFIYSGMTGNYSSYEDLSIEILDEDKDLDEDEFYSKYNTTSVDDVYELWEEAQNKLPDDVLQHSVDC